MQNLINEKFKNFKKLDEQLFIIIYLFCNNTKKRTLFFDKLNSLSKLFFIIIYVFFCIYFYLRKDSYLTNFLLFPFILLLLNIYLRKFFRKTRPYNNANINLENLGSSKSFSFPSNHASSSIIISLFIIPITPFGYIFLLLALITSFSRVARGYHYPIDVIFSFILASIIFTINLCL